MSYKVRILYEDGSEKSFDGIEKDNVENIIEHHSKPINGKVKEVKVEVEDSTVNPPTIEYEVELVEYVLPVANQTWKNLAESLRNYVSVT